LNSDLPAKLREIITKALEKNPDVRYQHASEIRADLKRLKRDMDSAAAIPEPQVASTKHLRRFAWSVAAIAAAVIAVSAPLAWHAWGTRPSRNPLISHCSAAFC
jgi:eukaryotic-like serine/threonine-protein kinase